MITLEYLAGLFDGEGWISIERLRFRSEGNHQRKTLQYGIRIGIGNTNEEIINQIHKEFGGKIYKQIRSKKSNKNWKRCFIVYWNGITAQELLKQILPFLIIKRNRAKLFIDFPYGKINERRGRKSYSEEENNKRKEIFEKLYPDKKFGEF